MLCPANQLTVFYMRGTLVVKVFTHELAKQPINWLVERNTGLTIWANIIFKILFYLAAEEQLKCSFLSYRDAIRKT